MKSETHKPLFMVADAGPDSHTSNQVIIDHGVIPIIAARTNSVGTILKTETGTHFREIYIPRKFHILLGKIYNLRTIVERKNSNEIVGYLSLIHISEPMRLLSISYAVFCLKKKKKTTIKKQPHT